MTISQKKGEKVLEGICTWLRIPIKRGWKTRLAEWWPTDLLTISNWYKRGLPKKQIEYVVKRGCPRDIVEPKSPPGSTIYPEDTRGQKLTLLRETPGFWPPHEEIIERFEDKDWAIRLNLMLVELERIAPGKKEVISAYVQGLLEGMKEKKKGNQS